MKYSILFKSCVLKSLLAPEEYGNHVFFLPGWGGGGGGRNFCHFPFASGATKLFQNESTFKGLGSKFFNSLPPLKREVKKKMEELLLLSRYHFTLKL